MSGYTYRLVHTDDLGNRNVVVARNDLTTIKSWYDRIRGSHDHTHDIFIERKPLIDWERFHPVVPANQTSIPGLDLAVITGQQTIVDIDIPD